MKSVLAPVAFAYYLSVDGYSHAPFSFKPLLLHEVFNGGVLLYPGNDIIYCYFHWLTFLPCWRELFVWW